MGVNYNGGRGFAFLMTKLCRRKKRSFGCKCSTAVSTLTIYVDREGTSRIGKKGKQIC
jgi:hypothetical protein